MELRLAALAQRIARMKQAMSAANGAAKVEALGEITRLEGRYNELQEQFNQLNNEGLGFRQALKAEIEARMDAVLATIDDAAIRLDRADWRNATVPKSSS